MVLERKEEELCGRIRKAAAALEEGDRPRAWQEIAAGLRVDPQNYELYMLLGDYYSFVNLRQAWLCYENACYFCNVPEDRKVIEEILEGLEEAGARPPKTAVVVLSCNLLKMTRDCIESIRETVPESAREIIVVDNGSTDGSVEYLRAQRDLKLLCNRENRGFPAACNQGIGLAEKNSDIYLLNNDTILADNSLFWLRMGLYEDARNGSAGSVTNHVSNDQAVVEDGRDRGFYLEFAGKNNVPLEDPHRNKVWLVGFSLLLKREALNQIGLLDERFFPGNYEDNDLCLRLMLAGYRNVLCRNSFLIHWGSSTFRKDVQRTNRVLRKNHERFLKKWEGIGLRD